MAAITGPEGPFVAAMVGLGPSWIAITDPPGPTVGGTSLRVLLETCITDICLICTSLFLPCYRNGCHNAGGAYASGK